MSLIHPRLLKHKLPLCEIPPAHLNILTAWRDSIHNRSLFTQTETALHSHFIQKILTEILDYQGFGGTTWNLAQEQKIGAGCVDVALGEFSRTHANILAPFELKGAKTKDLDAIMPGRHKSPVQQAWEYAMDAPGAQWVLLSNYLEIRLYAIGSGRQVYERWELAQLADAKEYARLQWLLNAKQLLSGETRKILEQSEQIDKEITQQLYKDYKNLREKLLQSLAEENANLNRLDLIRYAQKILDRILFIAFAEDWGLLPDKSIAQAYEYQDPYFPRSIWENFKALFHAIDQGSIQLKIPAYNGGLFAADTVLDKPNISDKICCDFKALAEYDFASEVSVTVLGHIFEQSISDIESLQAQARGEDHSGLSKRKQQGVVYTPDHITRFIVEHTLGAYLRSRFAELWNLNAAQRHKNQSWKKKDFEIQFWRDYQQILRTTRVLDPACGSGAFLVAAFDYLHEEYTRINDLLADLTGSYDVFDLDKEILNRNLYGVDVNAESIEITKLSLWIKTARPGKQLNSLDNNIQVGNSLINDPTYTDKPFDWQQFSAQAQAKNAALFENLEAPLTQMNHQGFDVVLGNPPYVRQELISAFKPYLEQKYRVYNGVVDLYAYFFELGIQLLKPGGRLGFISSSTFFKTSSGKNLRTFLVQNTALECIVDFKDLQIFEGVTTYPAILIMHKTQADKDHILRFQELEQIPNEGLLKDFIRHVSSMPQALLTAEGWKLRNGDSTLLWQKLTCQRKTLKEVCGAPLYGIKTGFNEAFVLSEEQKNQIQAQDPTSQAVLFKFLEGKDFKPWLITPRHLYLIYIPRGQAIENYPGVLAHLNQYRARLEPKPVDWQTGKSWMGRKAGAYQWYETQDTVAYYKIFESPKIMYSHFQSKPQFYFDQNGFFSNDKTYILPHTGFYELGLLQSQVYWWLITAMCPYVRGHYYELRVQYLETLPMPEANDAQRQRIAQLAERCQSVAELRYAKQEAVRQRIPDACPLKAVGKLTTKLKDWWLLDFFDFRAELKKSFKQDIPLPERNAWETWLKQESFEIQKLSAELQRLEQKLNTCVYALFDLAAAEIELIENHRLADK